MYDLQKTYEYKGKRYNVYACSLDSIRFYPELERRDAHKPFIVVDGEIRLIEKLKNENEDV